MLYNLNEKFKGVIVINKRNKKSKVLILVQRYFFITLGALIFSYGLESFLVPNNIIDGGIVGISMIISEITGLSLGIFLVILNLPFIYIGYKQLGRSFAIQSLYGIALTALFTKVLHHTPKVTNEPLLAAIFGGIVLGIGVGLVLRNNGALDGAEIVATLISEKTPFSVGQIIMFINFFILSSAGFVYGVDSAFYSLITYYIAFKLMDIVVEGLEESKQVTIISDLSIEIGDTIRTRLGRTVTYLQGEGAYSSEKKKVIYCVISRLEEAKLKTIVEEIDPDAFLATSNVSDAKGGQFKKKNIH